MFSTLSTTSTVLSYSGSSFLQTWQFFYCELGLSLAICAALLFLASNLNKIHSFLEQKEMALSLATFFSLSLILLGGIKAVWFLQPTPTYNYYFILTEYHVFLESMVAITGGFILYFSRRLIRVNLNQHLMEYPILFALSIWFLQLLIIANHLLITFIGLVGFSLNLYVMIMLFGPTTELNKQPLKINKAARHEASIKYFYLSTFSSSMVLLSAALFYTLAQTINLVELKQWITTTTEISTNGFLTLAWEDLKNVAVISLLLGFAFKISAFPSHFWAPEVYQGSSNSVTAFIILPVKVAALGAFSSILLSTLGKLSTLWGPILVWLAIGSMIVGALGALTEKKIKKFLAYSSINQVGFLLLGFSSSQNLEGIQSTIFFLIIYVATNILFFYFFLQIESKENNRPLIYLTDLNRLDPENYKVRFSWSIVFFSLAGLPPFAGFFSKFYVLLVAHHNGYYLAVFIGICTSLISAYYYLRVIKLLWFEKNIKSAPFVFTGYVPGARDYFLSLIFCSSLGLFLTVSFIWNQSLLLYCFDLAKSCCFPLTKFS